MSENPQPTPNIRQLVEFGDLAGILEYLRPDPNRIHEFAGLESELIDIAAKDPAGAAELFAALSELFATTNSDGIEEAEQIELREAIKADDPRRVEALIKAGADVTYCDANGYDALIDAAQGCDTHLLEVLKLLVDHGVALNGVTRYHESALRVLSRLGRFDAVQFLLEAGADRAHLTWTPLHEATALGTVEEMEAELARGAPLEARDYWERTAWLIAVQVGDIGKAEFLRKAGANWHACGRCGKPTLFYAIENHRVDMLRWLLAAGVDPEQVDEFGTTSLITAAEWDDVECIRILLAAGADIERVHNGGTAIGSVRSRAAAVCLLDAGADPRRLSHEGRRLLAGLHAEADEAPLKPVSAEEFRRARTPRYGVSNPERMTEPFWEAMVYAGVTGYQANQLFGGPSSLGGTPVWCAQRFGQSVTPLPDGCAILIAGEHEDHYDPDFCIYNDVIVRMPDGSIRIYGYPKEVFAPTDFHTATLCGRVIVIIGTLGYGHVPIERTPVYRLDTETLAIERVDTVGETPGWLYDHRADLLADGRIRVSGGKVVRSGSEHEPNDAVYTFDPASNTWLREVS